MQRSITTDEFLARLSVDANLVVLDVRTPEEVADWALPGVHNIPVEELADRLDEVPEHDELYVICQRGRRSLQAGEILEAAGIEATLISGGMSAWGRTFSVAAFAIGAVEIVQLRRVGKGCLSYLIGIENTCVLIDPSGDLPHLEREIAERGWNLTAVIDTHLHADHVSLAAEIARRHGARLVLTDHGYVDELNKVTRPLEDSSPLAIGTTALLEARVTPGHTQGSASYLLNGAVLFSGDTLFVDSVGRPDLADRSEEFAATLYETLHEGLGDLADEVLVLPSHVAVDLEIDPGELVGTTLGALRSNLAALALSKADFVSWAAARASSWPPNYHSIVDANRGLRSLSPEEAAELELGPNRCAVSGTPSVPLG